MYTNQSIDAAAESPADHESATEGVPADRYGDVALGVECAWPAAVTAD